MKKIRLAVLLLTVVVCLLNLVGIFSACKTEENNNEPSGYITAYDNELMTAANGGEKILLKGVNAGGWLLTEDYMCPTALNGNLSEEYGQYEYEDALIEKHGAGITDELYKLYRNNWWKEEDFDNIKTIGMNVVRLPFGWRDLQYPDYTYRENPFERLDYFVNNLAERGIYTILDLHGAHGSQNGKHHSGDTRTGGDLYGNEMNMARTEELWVQIANHYKDNKWIAGYDLLNEPEGVPDGAMNRNTEQWAYYDRLYNAIREVDINHLVIMEGVWEITNLPNPTQYNWTNVCYELHFYLWEDSNNFEKQMLFLNQKILLDALANYNVPILIGEFTFFENSDSWEYGLNLFNNQNWNWTIWTYKVMGENSSWGLYCGDNRTVDNTVNINHSVENIRSIWSMLDTSLYFTPNDWLIDIVKKYL